MSWIEPTLGWSVFILFLFALLMIYIKRTMKNERNIGWKLIGYFVLGMFTFRIEDELVLPVGFTIFLLFLLPRLNQNKSAKKWAAFLGAGLFVSNILITSSFEAYYERDITLKASTTNAYEMNFLNEYEKIKSAAHAEGDFAINNMEFSFDKDGTINQFNFNTKYYRDGKKMNAWVYWQDGTVRIVPSLSDQSDDMMQYQQNYNYISNPAAYFHALDVNGLKKMVSGGDRYRVDFFNENNEIDPGIKDSSYWDINQSGIKEHVIETSENSGDESIGGIPSQIGISTMKGTNAGYYSDHYDYYTISPELNDY